MKLAALVTTSAWVCLVFALCHAASEMFTLAGQDKQFNTFGTVTKLKVVSLAQCTAECLNMGSQCGSFSFSQTKLCTINVKRIQAQHVKQSQQLFKVESRTLVYGSMSGDVMPHGNVAVKETANYSYLLSHYRASWHEAHELCQQFGNGFYLANVDDANELDSLRPWLTDVSNFGVIWVSGTDEDHEGCWVWAAPVTKKLTDQSMWASNEPDSGVGQNCMLILRSYNWKFGDAGCSYRREYLCKRDFEGAFTTAEQAMPADNC